MSTSTHRLGILLPHPVQYFSPLFRRLAATPGVELTVLYCGDRGAAVAVNPDFGKAFRWDVPLFEGYQYCIMPNRSRGRTRGFFSYINATVGREIRDRRLDTLVVHGHSRATCWLAFAAARRAGIPVLMRGESHLLDEPHGLKGTIKRRLLRALYRTLAGALAIGTCNHQYYLQYGFSEPQLSLAPYSVDNEFFAGAYKSLRPEREALRRALGVTDARPLILFCGKLVPKKQPLLLLEAYEAVRRRHACALVYAGDGPLRREIEAAVRERDIPDVRITGFLNQTELPPVYTAADVFVLPSRLEPWGLVVNEAMNFGLPIIASDHVGSAYDLVCSGENGGVVPCNSETALAEALANLVSDADRREQFGQRSLELIDAWGLDQCAEGFVRGCRPRANCLDHRPVQVHRVLEPTDPGPR